MKEQQGPKKLTISEDESSTDPKAPKHQDTESQQSMDQQCSKNMQKMKAKCLRVCSLYIVVFVFEYFKWNIAVPFLCVLLCKSISFLCSLGTQHTKEKDPREWKEKGELEDRDNQASHELPILTSGLEEVQVSLVPDLEELFEQEHCCSVVLQNRQEQCQNGLAGPDQQNDPKQSQAHDQHSQKQEEEPSGEESDIINKLYLGELQATFHKCFKETQSLEFHSQCRRNLTDYQHFEGSRLRAVLASNNLQGSRSGKEHNRRNKKKIKKCKNRYRRDCSFNVQTHKVPRKKSGKCCRQMCHSTSQCLEHRGSADSEIQGKQIHKEDDLDILDFKLLQEQDNVVPKNREEQSPKQTRDTEQNFPRANSTKGPGSQVKQSLKGRIGPQHQGMAGPLQLQALGPNVLRNPVKQSFITPQLEESAYKHQHDAQERDTEKTERLTCRGQYKQNVPKSGRLKELLTLEISAPPLNNQKRKREAIWVASRQRQVYPFEIQCAELFCKRGTIKRSMRIVIDLLPTESLTLPDINRQATWWCPKDEQDVEWRDKMEENALEEKCLIETSGAKQPCPREQPHSEREGSNTIQTSEPQNPMEQQGTDLRYPQRQQEPEQKVHQNTPAIASEAPTNVLSLEDHCLEDLIKPEEQDSEQLQCMHSSDRKLKRLFLFKNRHRLKRSLKKHYANLIRKSGKSKKSIMIVNDLLAIKGLPLLHIKRWGSWWCPKDKQGLEQCNQTEGNVLKEQGIIETFGTEKHGPRQHPHLEWRGYNNPERPKEQQQVEKIETELLQKHQDPEQKVFKDPHVIVSEGPRNLLGLEELRSKVLVNSEEQESEQLQCLHSCDQMLKRGPFWLENRHVFKGPFEMHSAEQICETSKTKKPIKIVHGVLGKKSQSLLHIHRWGWCPRDDRGSEQQVYVVGKVCEEQGIPETLGTKEHYLREKPHPEWQDFNKQQKPEQQYPLELNETELEFPQKYQDPEQKLCKDLRVIPFIEMFGTDKQCVRGPSHLEGQCSNKLQMPEQQHPGKQKETDLEFSQKHKAPEQRVQKESHVIASDDPKNLAGLEEPSSEDLMNSDEQGSEQLQHKPTCDQMLKRGLFWPDNRHRFKEPFEMHCTELICERDKTKKPIQVVNGVFANGQPLLQIHKWGLWWCPRDDQGSEQVYVVGTALEEQGIPETLGTKTSCPREKPHRDCQDFNKPQKLEQQCPVEQKETEFEFIQKYQDSEQKICKDLCVIPFIEMFGIDEYCARVPAHLEWQYSNKLQIAEQQHPGEQKENLFEFPQKQQNPEQKRHKDLQFSEILGTEKHCLTEPSLLDWQYYNKLQIPEWQHLVEQKETEFDFPQKHRDPELRVEKDSQFIASDSPECYLDIEEEESEQLQCLTTCSQMHKRQRIRGKRKRRLKRLFDMHYAGWICMTGKTKKPIKVINYFLAMDGLPLLHINRWGTWWCPKEDQCLEQQFCMVRKALEEQGNPKTYGAKKYSPREKPYIKCQDFNKPQKPEHQYPVEQNETDKEFFQKHPNPEQKVCKDLQVIPFIEMLGMDKLCARVPSHLGCQYSNKQHMTEEWYPGEQKETKLEFPQKPNDPEQRVQKHSNAIALDDPQNLLGLEEPSSEHLINSEEQGSVQLPEQQHPGKQKETDLEFSQKHKAPEQRVQKESHVKASDDPNNLAGLEEPSSEDLMSSDEQGSEQLQHKPTCDQMLKRGLFWHDNQHRFKEPFLQVIPFIEMLGMDKHCPRVPSHLEWQYSNKHQMPEQQHPGEKKETGLVFPLNHKDPEQKVHKDPRLILFSEILGKEKHCPREHPLLEWQYSNQLQKLEQQHLVNQKETELEFPLKHEHQEQWVPKDSHIRALDDTQHLLALQEPRSEDLKNSKDKGSEELQHIRTCDQMLKRRSFWVTNRHRFIGLFALHHAEGICNTSKTKKSIKVVKCVLEKESLKLLHIHRWGHGGAPEMTRVQKRRSTWWKKLLKSSALLKHWVENISALLKHWVENITVRRRRHN